MASKKLLASLLVAAPLMLSVSGCSNGNTGNTVTIRVLNLDDYIYLNNPKQGYDLPDLTEQFEEYASELFERPVKVIYEVSDTNESEYNDLLTGRIKYDLVCTSDYMLQKFVREDLVTTLDLDKLDNYTTYASRVIKDTLDQIPVQTKDGPGLLKDYAVGYMWGTLGLLINPQYSGFDQGEEFQTQLFEDAQSWDILWNSTYKNAASIKNSMRDTYAVALMHAYDEELEALKVAHKDGEIDDATYNKRLSEIFNLTDEEVTLPKVKEELDKLKGNIFGLEVDSGKQDIITGKIGLNLAWSGDAVYSMDQAQDLTKLNEDQIQELYYAIPENGSNVWFDGWAMPKNSERDEITRDVALEFLNFLSRPDIAALNMDYTGYTSFIAGDEILDLVIDWYDIRTYLTTYELLIVNAEGKKELIYPEVYYIDPETHEQVESSFDDCHFDEASNPDYDEVELYYYYPGGVKNFIYEEDEEGNMVKATYNSYFLLDDYEQVDLAYFFEDTLVEYTSDDTLIYSDCYLPFEEEGNISVGRQFFCQYPSKDTILRCAIMADYGDANITIVKLWENFKSNPLPVWAIVLLIVEVVAAVGAFTYFTFNKRIKKSLRAKRKALVSK